METMTHKPGSWCGVPGCPCGGKPRERASVPDPVADTARALAGLYAQACDVLRPADDPMSLESEFKPREAERLREQWFGRRTAIADAARACGIQVEAAFKAIITGGCHK